MKTVRLVPGNLPTTAMSTPYGKILLLNCSLKNTYEVEEFSVHAEHVMDTFPFPFVQSSSRGNLLVFSDSIMWYDNDWRNVDTLLIGALTSVPSIVWLEGLVYGCNGSEVILSDSSSLSIVAGSDAFPLFENVCSFNGQLVGIAPRGLLNVPTNAVLFSALNDATFNNPTYGAEARLSDYGDGLGVHALNTGVVALYSDTITFMYPIENFIGQREIGSFGVKNRTAYAGSLTECMFINSRNELCHCNQEGRISTLGYAWLLQDLINPQITYNKSDHSYVISDATTTYVYRLQQLFKVTHVFTTQINNQIFGALNADQRPAVRFIDMLKQHNSTHSLLYCQSQNLSGCNFTNRNGSISQSKEVTANNDQTAFFNLVGNSFDVNVYFNILASDISFEYQQLDKRATRSRYVENYPT